VYRSLRSAAGVFAVVMLFAVSARAIDLQAGLWEISTKHERDGVTIPAPMRTKCIAPEQAKIISERAFPPAEFNRQGRTCKVSDLHKTDKEMTWRIECSGLFPAEQTGRYVVDSPQHYMSELKSSVKLPTKTLSSTVTNEGRRIGECPK
jgi:hypothetical protein